MQHLVNHPAAQKVPKKSPAWPRSQQGRSSYTQNDPEADRAAALQAQQKAAELSQQLGSETRVSRAGIIHICSSACHGPQSSSFMTTLLPLHTQNNAQRIPTLYVLMVLKHCCHLKPLFGIAQPCIVEYENLWCRLIASHKVQNALPCMAIHWIPRPEINLAFHSKQPMHYRQKGVCCGGLMLTAVLSIMLPVSPCVC